VPVTLVNETVIFPSSSLPNLSESEARTLGFALRTMKAARLRGVARVLYHSALRSAVVRTAGGGVVQYRRIA
jgi:hypothetical protein